MGDMLEHFLLKNDVVGMLKEGIRAMQPGGILIVTCPEDHRTLEDQGWIPDYEVADIHSLTHLPSDTERDARLVSLCGCRGTGMGFHQLYVQ